MQLIVAPAAMQLAQSGSSTDLAAGGADGAHAKAFAPQSASGVVVTLPSDSQVTTPPTQLTFTSSTRDLSQSLRVLAAGDVFSQGVRPSRIPSILFSTDADYSRTSLGPVSAQVVANDPQAPGPQQNPELWRATNFDRSVNSEQAEHDAVFGDPRELETIRLWLALIEESRLLPSSTSGPKRVGWAARILDTVFESYE